MKSAIEERPKDFFRDLKKLMAEYGIRVMRRTEQIDASPVELHAGVKPYGVRYYSIGFTEIMTTEEALPYLEDQRRKSMKNLWS